MATLPKKETQTDSLPPTFIAFDKWVLLGLFVFTFLLYANTLGHGFVLDDPLAIALNENVTKGISGIPDILFGGYRANNFGGQLYRPISLIQFAIEWSMGGNDPFLYHLFNVLWYCFTILMIYVVLRQWFANSLFPSIVALLFAIHPIHTEVVANIKSRDEIMSFFFIMVAFYCWNRYLKSNKLLMLIATMATYFLALISKESAVTMMPVFGLIAWSMVKKDAKRSILSGSLMVIPVGMLFMIRYGLFHGVPAPEIAYMDNPIVASTGLVERFSTSFLILFQYLKLLILPFPLSSDYSYLVIPLGNPTNIFVWLSLVLHLFLLFIAIKGIKTRSFISFSILGYLLSIFLYSQLAITIGTMFGERLAFLPSFWFVMGLVFYGFQLAKVNLDDHQPPRFTSIPTLMTGVVMIFTLVYAYLTITRNGDWKNNLTLFTKDSATYGQSVRLHNGAAEELLKVANIPETDENTAMTHIEKAEWHCNEIMKIKPVPTAFLTLGNIRMRQKKYDEAIQYYDQVNDLQSIVDKNKALALREMGRNAGQVEQNIPKSQDLLKKSLALNDQDAETWFILGVSYGVLGDHVQAAGHFEKAYSLQPSNEYAKNVITANQNLGNAEKVALYQSYIKQ